MGFEPTHRNRHYPLKVACLPISPFALVYLFELTQTNNLINQVICLENIFRFAKFVFPFLNLMLSTLSFAPT